MVKYVTVRMEVIVVYIIYAHTEESHGKFPLGQPLNNRVKTKHFPKKNCRFSMLNEFTYIKDNQITLIRTHVPYVVHSF
jgi:hypothetical protein